MRAARMFFTGSVSAVAVAILACGGSSQNAPAPGSDSGASDVSSPPSGGDASSTDATVAPDDAGEDSAVMCTPDADLRVAAPPDAALDDAGASVGTCIGCARAHCAPQIATCNSDCTCNNTFNCLFDCLGQIGGTLTGCYVECGGSLTGGGASSNEIALAECAFKSCAPACAACSLSADLCPPPDASAPDGAAGDASPGTDGAAGDASPGTDDAGGDDASSAAD